MSVRRPHLKMRSLLFRNDVLCDVDEFFRMYALGDRAITVEFGREPDPQVHGRLIAFHAHLQRHPFPGFQESVPAYLSLTVFFDPLDVGLCLLAGAESVYDRVRRELVDRLSVSESQSAERMMVTVPVCYDPEFGPDQQDVARHCGLSPEVLIDLHISVVYRVYMIGFVPGFPYLGMTDSRLDVPRKSIPRMQVTPGSVALAGRQTGIYPMAVPGGWQIIGRTPMRMYDPLKPDPFMLKPGMEVKFERIDRQKFENLSVR